MIEQKTMTIVETLDAQYKILGHSGLGITEVRPIPAVKRYFFTDRIRFSPDSNEPSVPVDWYVGINPRDKEGGKNEDVSHLTCLVVDIDPVRPLGQGSTDEQHEGAIGLGRKIMDDLPCSVLVDSGSGCHVYLPIEPIRITDDNREDVVASVRKFYEGIRAKHGTKDFKIDHIQDFARVIRIWGSWNRKSQRLCQPIGIEGVTEFKRVRFEVTKVSKSVTIVPVNRTPSEERFEQLCKNHPGISKMMSGKMSIPQDFPSRSEADYAFIAYLTKAHFSLEEIRLYARRNILGRQEGLSDKDVERIVTKIKTDNHLDRSFIHGTDNYQTGLNNRKPGYSTGFLKLDQMVAGLQRGKLYVIAARTNEGKTSFACNIAYNLVKQNISVLYFPTELGYEPLFDKLTAQASNVPLKVFQFGNFSDAQKHAVDISCKTLSGFPFIVNEDVALTLQKFQAKSKEICPSVIILDFIQAMKYNEGNAQEIAENVRGIKQIAEELKVPVIVCSQFSRGAINSEVSLQWLKGSGAIEELADSVWALSTVQKYESPRVVDLHVLKARYGELGKVRMKFYSMIGKFEEAGDE